MDKTLKKLVFLIIPVIFLASVPVLGAKMTSVNLKDNDRLGLPEMMHPKDNMPTYEKMELGRKLFMDRRLSHNNTISCAMCHVPEQGFAVNEIATAIGIEGRTNRRNAPTLLNVGFYESLFHDGREFTLEDQVIGPLVAHNEMGNPAVGYVVNKVRNLPDYDGMFEKAFGQEISLHTLNQAIAVYQRTLKSGNSRFDQWYYAKQPSALNSNEINGFRIFSGKAQCIVCHTVGQESALFTDQKFHNLGVGWARLNKPEKSTITVMVAPGDVQEVDADHINKSAEPIPNDVGRFEITEDPKDRWMYRTPSLRNVAITGPYMHDGSLATLEEVVEFYVQGGEENPLKDPLITPLSLTEQEKKDLVSFLNALTGSNVDRLAKEARAAYAGSNYTWDDSDKAE